MITLVADSPPSTGELLLKGIKVVIFPFTVDKVCELLYESDIKIEGIDHKELGLYLSLMNVEYSLFIFY